MLLLLLMLCSLELLSVSASALSREGNLYSSRRFSTLVELLAISRTCIVFFFNCSNCDIDGTFNSLVKLLFMRLPSGRWYGAPGLLSIFDFNRSLASVALIISSVLAGCFRTPLADNALDICFSLDNGVFDWFITSRIR